MLILAKKVVILTEKTVVSKDSGDRPATLTIFNRFGKILYFTIFYGQRIMIFWGKGLEYGTHLRSPRKASF